MWHLSNRYGCDGNGDRSLESCGHKDVRPGHHPRRAACRLPPARWRRWLLVLSIAARLAWTYLVPNGANFVDLHVYVGGAGAIEHPGSALRLRLRRPDARLPAAVHLSAVRGGRVPPAAPGAVRPASRSLGSSASSRRCTAWCGSSLRLLGPVADHRAGDAVDRRRHLDRTAAQHLRLRPDQRAPGAGGAVRGLQQRGGGCRAYWSGSRPGSS